jgi:hypothetical protein
MEILNQFGLGHRLISKRLPQTETKLTLKVRGENVSITRHFH